MDEKMIFLKKSKLKDVFLTKFGNVSRANP